MSSSQRSTAWDAEAVEQGIVATRFSGLVQHFETVTSTSTLALEAAQAGAPEGSIWIADEQTAGRGRGGHTWHSAPTDGLYFSLLLRPKLPPDKALWLSLATGLAVQSAILEVTGHTPDLRWPNDLLLGEKKFGGILVETALTPLGQTLRYAVIGIGLNVAHRTLPPDLDRIATSLYLTTATLYPRETILAAVLRALENNLAQLESEHLGVQQDLLGILARFAQASTWVEGKSVRVGEEGGYTGVTAGLDPGGFLRILADDGTMHTVLSGGVRPR